MFDVNEHTQKLLSVRQFEICSIRPPTENNSLTFRLTRNCYWNKCAFCPIYKTGARFEIRTLDEIKADITHARVLNELLTEEGFDELIYYRDVRNNTIAALAHRIEEMKQRAGIPIRGRSAPLATSPDPRMRWFSSWFIDYPSTLDCLNHIAAWRLSGGKTCFLGDADSLILKPDFVSEVLSNIRQNFPTITRFTIYGRTRTAARVRSIEDLKAFKNAGIDRVHFGIESGSATVLKLMNKGETPEDHVKGAQKAAEAGLSCSFYVMPGLGGRDLSEEHAVESARVINEAKPDYVRLRTLEVFEGTPLYEMRRKGNFFEADDDVIAIEIKRMIEAIRVPVKILSDSATNLLPVFGRLPEERDTMLAVINDYLSKDQRSRLEYSLQSRIQSFLGQYGGLSREVMDVIRPVIWGNQLYCGGVSDEQLKEMTAFVKSRLMP